MCPTCFSNDMSRRKPEVPSLADALAKGFSGLKTDDEKPPPVEDIISAPEVQDSVEIEPSSKPQYGRPPQHRGQEVSFIVNAKDSNHPSEGEEDTEKRESPVVEVLDKPSSSLGDDFDVQW